MQTGKAQQGKWLISLKDGQKLGEIQDLHLDPGMAQVVAAQAGREGLLSRKTHAVLRASVQVFGVDAWLVSGPDALVILEDQPGLQTLALSALRGREVQTDGGTKIGSVGDVLLDDQMQVTGVELGKVAIKGPLAESRRIPRAAIKDWGGPKAPVLVDLAQAEAAAS